MVQREKFCLVPALFDAHASGGSEDAKVFSGQPNVLQQYMVATLPQAASHPPQRISS